MSEWDEAMNEVVERYNSLMTVRKDVYQYFIDKGGIKYGEHDILLVHPSNNKRGVVIKFYPDSITVNEAYRWKLLYIFPIWGVELVPKHNVNQIVYTDGTHKIIAELTKLIKAKLIEIWE